MKVLIVIHLFKTFLKAFSGLNKSRFVNEFTLWASISPIIFRQQMGMCGCFLKNDETGKEEKIKWKERETTPFSIL